MRKNIWFIMGGMMVITTLLTLIVQNTLLILIIQRYIISTPQPSMPTPTKAIIPPETSALSTLTPGPLPTFTMPLETSTFSPDIVRQRLAALDQQAQDFDNQVSEITPEQLDQYECPYVSRQVPDECWIYRIGIGNMVVLKGYTGLADLYVYDFDGDERPEILKWDLARDNQFDVIEYDIDKDGKLDYALADMNGNGHFENDEIYLLAGRRWQSLTPGVLPFPVLPLFPY